VNALLQAIEFIQATVDQGFDIQLTRLEGGETVNQIPDRARVEFYLTSHQFEDFKRYFRETTKVEGRETAFKVELGGLGESGISFLPSSILTCVNDAIRFFSKMVTELERSWSEEFDPPTPTISLGAIKQEPRGLEMLFDVRLLPWLSADEIDRKVQAGIAELALKYPSFNIKVARERINPGLEVPVDHEWVKICQSAMEETGLRPDISKMSLCSEAGLFASKGFPSLSIGPGVARGNVHGPNERALMPQLQQAVSLYEKMIEKVCL
jgi:acetylornithine deacetylase/succinyl-diaminopimelate desuccinylase-like protein